MFSLALLAAALFLGLSVSSAVRERTYGYYLRHYLSERASRRFAAQTARIISWVFGGAFYLCVGGAIAGLIYATVLVGAYAVEWFLTISSSS